MWWPEAIIISTIAITGVICLGLMLHLLQVQKRGRKLKAWIAAQIGEFNKKLWSRLLANRALNDAMDVSFKDPEQTVSRLLEFYERKDLAFYFDQIQQFGTDEDVIYGMEYLEEYTTLFYLQHERMLPIAEIAKMYFRDKEKRPLNGK